MTFEKNVLKANGTFRFLLIFLDQITKYHFFSAMSEYKCFNLFIFWLKRN